jgi:hypothetical protein
VEIINMITWWAIEFANPVGQTGYQKMEEGTCLGVFFQDGTPVTGNVEYTTVDTNSVAPSWA